MCALASSIESRNSRQHPGETKTLVAVPALPDAIGENGSAVELRPVDKRTAAEHARRAIARYPGTSITWRAVVIPVGTVLNPFPYVSAHIVKAESVGSLLRHRMRGIV